jgi:2-haloacid dehalogenase
LLQTSNVNGGGGNRLADMTPEPPPTVVFDGNETLIDIESLRPHCARIFGDLSVLRQWFDNL